LGLNTHRRVDKLWGSEEWIVNSPLYCGKILCIAPGFQCSLHYHARKTETFLVLTGKVSLEVYFSSASDSCEGQSEVLGVGDSYTITPGVAHRFRSLDPAGSVVVEFSTQHFDDDSYRLEESCAIGNREEGSGDAAAVGEK
jgi:mannose-6-phosphate isomerase-like protein (cupin superfamily)